MPKQPLVGPADVDVTECEILEPTDRRTKKRSRSSSIDSSGDESTESIDLLDTKPSKVEREVPNKTKRTKVPQQSSAVVEEIHISATEDFDPELVQIEERAFNEEDQKQLCINEHERFMKASDKVGHALIYTDAEGTFAKQFNAPSEEKLSGTQIRPVENIRFVLDKFGEHSKEYIRAETPNGTEMVGKRKVKVTTINPEGAEQEHDLWRLSPVQSHLWKGSLFVGAGPEELPIFSKDLSKRARKELEDELKEIEPNFKEKEWTLESESVLERERRKNEPRKPQQNDVMGHSAFEELESFREQYASELHPERRAIFEKNKDAKQFWRGGSLKSQYRGEWLHLKGHGLTPMSEDPQTEDNLAAGPKWLNSQMMTDGERTAKWVALHRPHATIDAKCKFNLIADSHIIDHGHMQFKFQEAGQTVMLDQTLNPWRKYVAFPKPTDVAQTTLVTSKLLMQEEADSIQPVKTLQGGKSMFKKPTSSTPATKSTSSTQKPAAAGGAAALTKEAYIEKLKSSIVRVFTRGYAANYGKPHYPPADMDWTGSGVVVEEKGKLYILTNAHVVENHLDVRVRLANDDDEYEADVLTVGYQCDMAIMKVTDPKFLHKAKPLKLGEMLKVGEEVEVFGFPMGGEEMSYTTGPVSRIMVDHFSEGGEVNLQVQTQAPTNPGNSGGPVISKGKIVGLAFQTLEGADGLHYLIPVPVMRHFIDDALNPNGYKGFPDIGMDLQELTNTGIRRYYGLKEHQTGVRIKSVDPMEDAARYLKRDDIIVAVDGIKVSNDAKINVPNIGERLDMNYLWLRKNIGDTVNIQILRRNPTTGALEPKVAKVKLMYRAGQTKKVGPIEFDKSPTYYINSGILFHPLTPNYLESTEGLEFREIRMDDDAHIQEIPRKHPDDQIIIINKVFKCKHTAGFHDVCNKVVKEVNGMKIRNMHDLVTALESNKHSDHAIVLQDKELIVVPNLPPREHLALLDKYGIKDHCSKDLKPSAKHKASAAEVEARLSKLDAEIAKANSEDELLPDAAGNDADSESCHTDDRTDESVTDDEAAKAEMADFIEDDLVSETQATVDEIETDDEAESAKATGGFTGRKTYLDTVKRIERKAQAQAAPLLLSKPAKKRRLVVESDEEEMADDFTSSSRQSAAVKCKRG